MSGFDDDAFGAGDDFDDVPLPPDSFEFSKRRQRMRNIISVVILVLILGGVIGGFLGLRTTILKEVPSFKVVYEALGLPTLEDDYGLIISDIAVSETFQNGVPVLTVTGAISNEADAERTIPVLQIQLLDQYGQSLYSWTHPVEDNLLEVGAEQSFESKLTNPPGEAVEIRVSFIIPEMD